MTIDVQALRDLLSRATPGEWRDKPGCRIFAGINILATVWDTPRAGLLLHEEGRLKDEPWLDYRERTKPEREREEEVKRANAAFIAAAKNSMAALLDAYEERERMTSSLRFLELAVKEARDRGLITADRQRVMIRFDDIALMLAKIVDPAVLKETSDA